MLSSAEWLDSFLALDAPAVPAWIRGAALVARGQLALSSDPAVAETSAREGLALCRTAENDFWTAAALNLLAESALHTWGRCIRRRIGVRSKPPGLAAVRLERFVR